MADTIRTPETSAFSVDHVRACKVGGAPADVTPQGVLGLGSNVDEWTTTPLCRYPDHDCCTDRHPTRGGGGLPHA